MQSLSKFLFREHGARCQFEKIRNPPGFEGKRHQQVTRDTLFFLWCTRMLGSSDARTAREQKPDTRVTLNRADDEKRTSLRATDGAFSMTDRITQFHGSFEATAAPS